MGVRFRKYFNECKAIHCSGRRARQCPETPKRSNGEYKTCGVWCIEFFDDRKEWQSLTFKDVRNKTEAERRLAMFIGDRERGKLHLPKKKVIPTLAEYSKTYLELYKNSKENTRIMKKSIVTALVKYLGDYSLDKITPFVIEKYRIERKEKDGIKDSSINIDIAILGHVFNTAIRAGIVDKNPCKDVKRLKVSQIKDRILTTDEISLVFGKLQGKDRLMVLVGLFTGMRLNEVLRLKWTDIDFAKGLITFIQSKTGKLVSIPLSSYLSEELLEYKENNSFGLGDKIFESREITNAIVIRHSEHFSHLFKGLGIHNFTFHNLRHTFSSLQAELGTGAVVTKDLLGHSTLDMTLRYSHTGLDSKKKAIETLTEYVLSIGEKAIMPVVSKTGTA